MDRRQPRHFYYEIQLSSDPLFNTDPFSATAAVYWNLIHGGQTSPQNSWAVPASARLDADGRRYYWRVRPRVQGNGTPVNWGLPFWFTVGSNGGGCLVCPDLAVTDVQLSASNVVAGSQVQVQYTVKNVGAGGSAPTDVRALLSNEVTINRLRTDLGPLGTLSALTSTIPANTPVGSYFLGVYGDWAGVNKEAERGKDGNNGLGKLLTVTVPVTPVPGVTPPTATASPTATPSPTATNMPSPTPTFTPTPDPILSGYTIVTNTRSVGPMQAFAFDVSCGSGKSVLGGGWSANNSGLRMQESRPSSNSSWRVEPNSIITDTTIDVTAYAVCASVSNASGYTIVTNTRSVGPMQAFAFDVSCGSGKSVLGG
ncbi:MAG: hypothetical protein NTZ05_20865, partial [Chloroflexi bacterium]|nr:hypothetical protein [Chloroflexota bacterium]